MCRAMSSSVVTRCARERVLGRIGVVGDAPVEDLFVLGAAALERAAVVEGRDPIALAVLPERADQARQPARARGGVQAEVEIGVRGARAHVVAHAEGGHVLVEGRARSVGVLVGEAAGGEADRRGLEQEPRRVGVAQVVLRDAADARAAVGDVLGEPEALELAHRLADRHRAHVERARQRLEAERRARRELPAEDRLLQVGQRALGQGAMPSVRARDHEALSLTRPRDLIKDRTRACGASPRRDRASLHRRGRGHRKPLRRSPRAGLRRLGAHPPAGARRGARGRGASRLGPQRPPREGHCLGRSGGAAAV